MEIVTKEQMDELDGLIKKYSNPEVFEETVAGVTMLMRKDTDTSPLIERRKRLITQEQCENIVAIASNLLKIIPKADFVYFLHKNKHVFHFDIVYFIKPTNLNYCIKETKGDIDSVIKTARSEDFFNFKSPFDCIDLEKVATTYTNLTKFREYIRIYPLTKDDVLRIIPAKQNC